MSKVVLIGPAHPLRGGIANFNERLAKAFQAEGHEVRIITFSLQYPSFLFPGKTQYSKSPAPEDLDIEVAINSIQPVNWRKIGRQLKKEKPDLIIPAFWLPIMGLSLGIISGIARMNKHSKSIALVHNMIPHESRPGDTFFSRMFVHRVDGFVTLSRSVVDDIGRFDEVKPKTYHPHPIYDHFGPKVEKETARKELGLDQDKRYLLFFGIIRQYKGLDLLLEAMARAEMKSRDDLRLIVAGEFYEDETPYLNLIDKHSISEKVLLKNHFIPDEQVAQYFSACDVVVQPYRSATQSGVTQIAYHYEKPMIVTDVGGLSEMVPHEKVGLVTKPEPEELAKSILHIFENDRLEKMEHNTKVEKARFGWDRMVKTFMEMLEELQKTN